MGNERTGVRAVDFIEKTLYSPRVRPGVASWIAVWPHVHAGEYLVNFMEIRPGAHAAYRPIPLEFWEAMGLPIKYQSQLCNGDRKLVYESVILRTTDNGLTWAEAGRNGEVPNQIESCFSYCSLPDGSIVRALDTQYVSFYPHEVPELKVQRSKDFGTTWEDIAQVMKGFFAMPCRLKRLSDGTLVLLTICAESFGPGKAKKTRNQTRPNTRIADHQVIFASPDDGRTWAGPYSVFQGVSAPEADFVELPSGDLLFLNSTIQHGPAARQRVFRQAGRFVPGPVFDVVAGEVPETFVRASDGMLVGANRKGRYSCSNDEGETWHLVSEARPCGYQPMIAGLDDGRFLCVWHFGGDDVYGEVDQYIGAHLFGLESDLPFKTSLDMERDMNGDRTHYLNSFTFTLTSNGHPLPGRRIAVSIDERYRESVQTLEIVTDQLGKARCDVGRLDRQRNIHLGYTIRGRYNSQPADGTTASCESGTYHAYALTARKGSAHRYGAFIAKEALWVTPEAADAHPALVKLVDAIRDKDEFTVDEVIERAGLERCDVEDGINFLLRESILSKIEGGTLAWIWKVTRRIRRIEIEDDFV